MVALPHNSAMSKPFAKLVKEAARWGITFKVIVRKSPTSGYKSPVANTAIRKDGVIELYGGYSVLDEFDLQGLLHEVCHAIVWTRTGATPKKQTECGPELWLEAETSRRLRLPGRARWQSEFWPHRDDLKRAGIAVGKFQDYYGFGIQWHDLSTKHKNQLLTHSRTEAVQAQLVDGRGLPTYRSGFISAPAQSSSTP